MDRPLGQELPPRKAPGGGFRLQRKTVVTAAAVLAVVAASAAIALRGNNFRTPAVEVAAETSKPAVEPKPAVEAAPQPEIAAVETKPDGPSIIKVAPSQEQSGSGIVVLGSPEGGQDLRVAHMPDRNMIEQTKDGPLPKRGADGRRPFDAYARPWSNARGARVAIVIGGLAVSQTGTQQAINRLPPEVTLAFASQGNSIGRWMTTARQRGHEILMQLPLEPFDYPNVNPGNNTLTVEAEPGENAERLHWVLSRTTNYTGVMNYMGGRFVADAGAMQPLLEELGQRGLLFLDDGTSARSAAEGVAAKAGTPFAAGDTIIDDVQDRGAILKKLDQLEATARAKGFAVGTGSAFGVTVDAVVIWANEAKKRGIEIVPVSAVANDPERS
jgi:polysaccharide deacetylase 2 family uncharacterized protein YibQ